MSDIQRAIEVIQTEKECVIRQQCDRNCSRCDLVMQAEDILSAYDAAIVALQEKQHNDELRKRLRTIYGDEVSVEQIIEEFIQHIEEPNKPLRNAKILTYEDAEKWERWKQEEQQGRLVELPCAIGDTVYRICPKCNDKHDSSCVGCAWEFSASHRGCDVYGLWKDGQYPPAECTIVPHKVDWNYIPNLLEHIGKTVFLTHEAACEKLEEMKGDTDED